MFSSIDNLTNKSGKFALSLYAIEYIEIIIDTHYPIVTLSLTNCNQMKRQQSNVHFHIDFFVKLENHLFRVVIANNRIRIV